jgi:hypothetical protein
MQLDIKLVKLVSGDVVMGQYDPNERMLKDLVMVQTVPVASGGIQVVLLPFGFPYDDNVGGKLDEKYVMYEYAKVPEELSNKYLETKSNIRIASSLSGLDKKNGGSGIIL